MSNSNFEILKELAFEACPRYSDKLTQKTQLFVLSQLKSHYYPSAIDKCKNAPFHDSISLDPEKECVSSRLHEVEAIACQKATNSALLFTTRESVECLNSHNVLDDSTIRSCAFLAIDGASAETTVEATGISMLTLME